MVATTPTQVPKDAVEELVHFLDAKKFRVPSTEEQECDFHYEERCERLFVNQVVRKLVEIHTTVPAQEHVCVFLPTARDVERCGVDFISAYDTLVHSNENQLPVVDFVLLHVHQNTSQLDFTRIFFPTDLNTRKIVLATPDLETCFVGDTIAHIIDSGYGCRTQLNFRSGFEFTTAAPVTQAAAAARASRLSHNRKFRGIVHRMYSETVLAKLAEAAAPAVLHTSVVEMVVCLKAAVAAPVLHIQLRTQPSEVAVVCAFHQLYIANVLARDGRLSTQIRELVSQLSLHPLHGIMLAAATQSGCVHEMACALAWANTTALQLHYTHTLELDECVRVHRIYHTSYLHRGDSKSHYTFRVSSHAPPLRISLCDLQLFHSAVVALETLCQRSSALRTVQLPSHLLPHTPSGTHAPSKLQVCRHIITVVNPLSLASLTHSREQYGVYQVRFPALYQRTNDLQHSRLQLQHPPPHPKCITYLSILATVSDMFIPRLYVQSSIEDVDPILHRVCRPDVLQLFQEGPAVVRALPFRTLSYNPNTFTFTAHVPAPSEADVCVEGCATTAGGTNTIHSTPQDSDSTADAQVVEAKVAAARERFMQRHRKR
uniref:ATP-dependent RNA helicase dhx8 n=1 Tax=Lygus hesperus TaxID=30085 RepID=A0A0A9Z748_LYGHE